MAVSVLIFAHYFSTSPTKKYSNSFEFVKVIIQNVVNFFPDTVKTAFSSAA